MSAHAAWVRASLIYRTLHSIREGIDSTRAIYAPNSRYWGQDLCLIGSFPPSKERPSGCCQFGFLAGHFWENSSRIDFTAASLTASSIRGWRAVSSTPNSSAQRARRWRRQAACRAGWTGERRAHGSRARRCPGAPGPLERLGAAPWPGACA